MIVILVDGIANGCRLLEWMLSSDWDMSCVKERRERKWCCRRMDRCWELLETARVSEVVML